MSWNLVGLDEVKPISWLNGGGLTRELLTWPGPEDWTLRMSVADVVQDGPFSSFAGIRRWFAVLSGAGVRLTVDGTVHELTSRSAPLLFQGGAATRCELLDGPTQDFNLMLRSGSARMNRVAGSRNVPSRPGVLLAVYADAGATITVGGERLDLSPKALAWRILDSDAPVELTAEDALCIEIESPP